MHPAASTRVLEHFTRSSSMPTTRRSQAERSPVAGEKRGPRTPTSVEKAAQEKRVASVPAVEPVARRSSRSMTAKMQAGVGSEGAAEASIGNASGDAFAAAEQLLGFGEAARVCEPPPAPPPLAPSPPDPPLADPSGGGTELFADGLEMLQRAAAGEGRGALPARPPRVEQRVPRPPGRGRLDEVADAAFACGGCEDDGVSNAPPELAVDDQDVDCRVHVVTRQPRVSPTPTHAVSRTQSSSSSRKWKPFTSLGHTQGARQGRTLLATQRTGKCWCCRPRRQLRAQLRITRRSVWAFGTRQPNRNRPRARASKRCGWSTCRSRPP